jgi:hypothetical protein
MSFTNLIETATATGLTINSAGNVGLGGGDPSERLNISSSNATRSCKIIKVANGYQVEIGCQTFVFESLANMLYRLDEYYTNPSKIEEHFHIQGELPVILPKKK